VDVRNQRGKDNNQQIETVSDTERGKENRKHMVACKTETEQPETLSDTEKSGHTKKRKKLKVDTENRKQSK
jgi:hypothetical protein